MAEEKLIDLALIDPPLVPMRIDTLGEGLEELIADLREKGQLQNIGVVDLQNGRYRLVWGSRRCAAFEAMSRPQIRAAIHQPGEIDELEFMAAENFQRTQLNPVEEGEFYASLIQSKSLSIAECARRVHKAPQTVSRMLSFVAGDIAVRDALRAGEINAGQAEQLNLVKDEIGRTQGLAWARSGLLTARQLAQWRENREVTGISASIEQVKENLENMPQIDLRTMAKCCLHNDYVELMKAPPRVICDECWDLTIEALSWYHQTHGSESDPPPPPPPADEAALILALRDKCQAGQATPADVQDALFSLLFAGKDPQKGL